MKDALGQEITEGYAALVNPGRGSISATKVYVIGTKGKASVELLGGSWRHVPLEELIAGHKQGNPDVPKSTKIATRIIMLGDNK
jgi:hypothetical protein